MTIRKRLPELHRRGEERVLYFPRYVKEGCPMKKIISAVLALAVGFTLFTPVALADEDGEERVTMGADLTDRQRAAVYADFGIEEGTVTELSVTNDEERSYLEGLGPDGKIGSVALSCIYIKTLPAGTGMKRYRDVVLSTDYKLSDTVEFGEDFEEDVEILEEVVVDDTVTEAVVETVEE